MSALIDTCSTADQKTVLLRQGEDATARTVVMMRSSTLAGCLRLIVSSNPCGASRRIAWDYIHLPSIQRGHIDNIMYVCAISPDKPTRQEVGSQVLGYVKDDRLLGKRSHVCVGFFIMSYFVSLSMLGNAQRMVQAHQAQNRTPRSRLDVLKNRPRVHPREFIVEIYKIIRIHSTPGMPSLAFPPRFVATSIT